MSTEIDWVSKIREALKTDSDEEVGKAGSTTTSRLADEILNRCRSNPNEAMSIIEALFVVTREVGEHSDNLLLDYAKLSFLSGYVPSLWNIIKLAIKPKI